MKKESVRKIVQALNDAGVEYMIAGGLAVVAYGYLRFTADVDVVVRLDPRNAANGIAALKQLGYRPLAPVPAEDFADPVKRAEWIREKRLKVFSLHSDIHRGTAVDLFVESPFDFDEEARCSGRMEIAPGVSASFVSLDRLIQMKVESGRPQDLIDIEALRKIKGLMNGRRPAI